MYNDDRDFSSKKGTVKQSSRVEAVSPEKTRQEAPIAGWADRSEGQRRYARLLQPLGDTIELLACKLLYLP
jgi:hypothetical protein